MASSTPVSFSKAAFTTRRTTHPRRRDLYFDQKETRRARAVLPEQLVPFHLLLSVFTDPKRKDGYEPAMMRVARVRAWAAPEAKESK